MLPCSHTHALHCTTRRKLGAELRGACPQVLELVRQSLAYDWKPEGVHVRAASALKCVTSWTKANNGPTPDIVVAHLVQAQAMVGHPVLGELLIEFVIAIVEGDKSAKYPATIKALLPLVAQWGSLFKAAIAAGNEDFAKGVCRAAVAIGEGHIEMLMETKDANERASVQQLLQVRCTFISILCVFYFCHLLYSSLVVVFCYLFWYIYIGGVVDLI